MNVAAFEAQAHDIDTAPTTMCEIPVGDFVLAERHVVRHSPRMLAKWLARHRAACTAERIALVVRAAHLRPLLLSDAMVQLIQEKSAARKVAVKETKLKAARDDMRWLRAERRRAEAARAAALAVAEMESIEIPWNGGVVVLAICDAADAAAVQ